MLDYMDEILDLQHLGKLYCMHVYLFKGDFYFSGISADASALIHDYTNIFDNNEL